MPHEAIHIENNGSVARDHLALERTFLAWLRFSLSLGTVGAVLILNFRLPDTAPNMNANLAPAATGTRVSGIIIMLAGVLVMGLALFRYLRMQYLLPIQRALREDPSGAWAMVLICIACVAYSVWALVWGGTHKDKGGDAWTELFKPV